MLITFVHIRGIVHKEFVPQWQKVNQAYYRQVLERLRERVIRVRPETVDSWMLHHDNAPRHTALPVNEYLAKKGIPVSYTHLDVYKRQILETFLHKFISLNLQADEQKKLRFYNVKIIFNKLFWNWRRLHTKGVLLRVQSWCNWVTYIKLNTLFFSLQPTPLDKKRFKAIYAFFVSVPYKDYILQLSLIHI